MDAYRREIRDNCGLSPENVKPVMLGLERDRFRLQIAVEPKKQHVRILTKMVAEIAKQAKTQRTDRVTAGLLRIIDARRDTLKSLRSAQPGVSEDEVRKADADVAEAEVRLALREEEIARSQGDGELERLNRQLRELSTEVTLDEIRLEALERRLKALMTRWAWSMRIMTRPKACSP